MKASDLHPQTPYVTPDEKAMGLLEVELLTPSGTDIHRYQLIYVIRNDQQTVHVVDLGSRLRYPNPPLSIPAYMEHTVAELQDMAVEARGRSSVTKRLAELQEQSTKDKLIIKEFLERKDRIGRVVANKSHYGPTTRIQRIGYNGKR